MSVKFDFYSFLRKSREYLSNTIDNFRDFIKGDKSYTNISIKDVLDNSLTLVAASLNNNFINLILELNDDLTIFGNKNELTEAFLNIISNSKDILKTIEEKVHPPEQFGQPADLHPDTLPELIRTASRFIFGQF